MKHFVHYLNREIKAWSKATTPFFADQQRLDQGFDRPLYHVTRSKSGPTSQIEEGSILWLFSSLKSPWGKLPPSLDGKFIVAGIEKNQEGKTKFNAHKDSSWYPLFDATQILKKLKTIDRNLIETKLWENSKQPLGYYLQSIRQLSNGVELLDYSNQIITSDFDFISYRIKDGTKQAFLKTAELIKKEKLIFWDRYCLPRRLVERRELIDDAKLDEYLNQMIRKSSKVFGIESKKYSEKGSYSEKEAELAKALNKYISC